MRVISNLWMNDKIVKVLGFDVGAMDYFTKPFDTPEVLAQVQSVFLKGECGFLNLNRTPDLN